MALPKQKKSPEANLDYIFDWAPESNGNGLTDYLEADEVISSYEISLSEIPSGSVVVESHQLINAGKSVLVWISGGGLGKTQNVTCKITTNKGRTDTRTMILSIETT